MKSRVDFTFYFLKKRRHRKQERDKKKLETVDLLTSTGVDNNVKFMENNIVIVIMKSVVASQRSIPCHFITSLMAVHHSLIVTARRTNSSGDMAKGAKNKLSIL